MGLVDLGSGMTDSEHWKDGAVRQARLGARVADYLAELHEALNVLDHNAVWGLIEALMTAGRERRQVILMGNGGSAALASHMVNDLNKIIVPGIPRWRAMALNDNVPLLTAWANDAAYDRVFAEPLLNLCQAGDLVIAVSCSGNSRNVLEGVRVAKELGATVIGLTGDRGGRLAEMVDLCVRAPAAGSGQQEDIHMILDHLAASSLRQWAAQIGERLARPPRALILAAGEGSRLRPLTSDRPKPMLPVAGQPLLEHTVRWLRGYGVKEIAVNLHYHPEAILSHFGDGSAFDVRMTYSHEDPILGTAGAVSKLADFLAGGPFVVVYGDVLTDLNLRDLLAFHHERAVRDPDTAVTMSMYHVPNPTEVGLVGTNGVGRVTRFLEKPKPEEVFTDLANAGILVVEPWVIQRIPRDTFCDFGNHLLPQLLTEGVPLYGWPIPAGSYLLDIGTPEKYSQAQVEWPGRKSRG
jgi:mannose-1-phosphate guanylyltransferase